MMLVYMAILKPGRRKNQRISKDETKISGRKVCQGKRLTVLRAANKLDAEPDYRRKGIARVVLSLLVRDDFRSGEP